MIHDDNDKVYMECTVCCTGWWEAKERVRIKVDKHKQENPDHGIREVSLDDDSFLL